MTSGKLDFDHIIIGAGSAGCVVAARLAKAGRRVALIEAGGSDLSNPLITDIRQWEATLQSEIDYDYTIAPQPRGNSKLHHPRGKVLGGSSSINSCVAFAAPDVDMNRWHAEGALGWDAASVAPYFSKVFNTVKTTKAPTHNPYSAAVVQAAEAYGFPVIDLEQPDFDRGVGYFSLNVVGTERQNAALAYLHPLAQWGDRLQVFTDTTALRIVFDGTRAIGVETSNGLLYAQHDIVLSTGSFVSPKLLQLSGVGNADLLRSLGIPLTQSLPGVGENLLDHPEGVVNFALKQPMPDYSVHGWAVGIFENIDGFDYADLMYHVGEMPFDTQTTAHGFPAIPRSEGVTFIPNVTRAKSQGTVRITSTDPLARPDIDFRYFTDPEGYDERIMLEGIKLARELAHQHALQPWISHELTPGNEVQSDTEISAYARKTANTVYHPAGTCKMGTDNMAVVDPELKVHGIENLRVADASVFPSMIGVNPNFTIMMIGERCADFVLHD